MWHSPKTKMMVTCVVGFSGSKRGRRNYLLTYLEGVTLKVILFSENVFMFSCFLLGFRFYYCCTTFTLLLPNYNTSSSSS
jgi:hypothetical protein